MGSFNVDEYLKSQGLTLKGKDSETGQFQVAQVGEDGKEVLGTFDPRQFLKAQNVDISNVEIIANSPESALQETRLGFLDQMDLMAAKKPGEKLTFLEKKFGKGNAKIVQDEYGGTSLTVKGEDGIWSKADTGFLASIAKESPVIAGGIAGSVAGAKMGVVLGPKGILAGSVLGGAIGATLGRVTDIASAEAAGIRTESDAQDAAAELGKEFAMSVASAGVMYVGGRAVVKGVEVMGGPVKRALENAAGIASQLTRRSKETFETLFDPQYTKQVSGLVNELVEAESKQGFGVIDKATQLQVGSVNKILTAAKQKGFEQYEVLKQQLKANGEFDNIKIDMDPVLKKVAEIKQVLFDKSPGSVSTSVDPGTLAKMQDIIHRIERATTSKSAGKIAELSAKLEKTYNPTVRANLEAAISKLQEGGNIVKSVGFDVAEGLKRNLDEMLELSGHFNAGDHAISSTGRRLFKDLRNTLVDDSMGVSLSKTSGVKIWNQMRSDYKAFRDIYDDFAITGKKFFNDERSAQTITRMMSSKKGDFLKQDFAKLVEYTGDTKSFDVLKIATAAKELQPMYSIEKGGIGQVASNIGSMGLTSPREVGRHLAMKKVADSSVKMLNGAGKAVDFFTKLDSKSKIALFNNEALYKPVFRALYETGNEEEAMAQEILKGTGL